MDNQEKLEAYRLRKRRKERFESFKQKLKAMIPFHNTNEENTSCIVDVHVSSQKNEEKLSSSPVCSELDEEFVSEDDETVFPKLTESPPHPIVPTNKYLRYFYWIVMFSFWVTCYIIAIELKFGVVFLLFSALFGIYFNTRTGPKKHGEISAYSVFNKDCVAIDGTLNAEQFEREIRYGPANVR